MLSQALQAYVPRDNQIVHDCLAELLRDVSLDEPRPDSLQTEGLGSYGGPLLPEERG